MTPTIRKLTSPTAPYLDRDVQGWTLVNDAGDEPYLNYCRRCGWASDIALWKGDGTGPKCPRCLSAEVGQLVPKHEGPQA